MANKNELERLLQKFEEEFPIVPAEELAGDDVFIRAINALPAETEDQFRIKGNLKYVNGLKLKNFRKGRTDSSILNRIGIIWREIYPGIFKPFADGQKCTAVINTKALLGLTPIQWNTRCQVYIPSKESRLGTILDWDLYMCCLLKDLVMSGDFSLREAWNLVTIDSTQLNISDVNCTPSVISRYLNLDTPKIVVDRKSPTYFSVVGEKALAKRKEVKDYTVPRSDSKGFLVMNV